MCRAAPGKSGLHARGEGERVLTLESREGTRASRRVEEGLSRSLSGKFQRIKLTQYLCHRNNPPNLLSYKPTLYSVPQSLIS